ncbi:ScbA/BarX family gamma-butyrolactone biosynthesis protein [Streptomyces sp. NPDC089919]|uniref:ScbA/BarX family gamma-butyrolactone biosynthesis protein n=1 Tax=Streptomyces sp. NPDC089919 TaxID=3155188 RepID=UPI0034425154
MTLGTIHLDRTTHPTRTTEPDVPSLVRKARQDEALVVGWDELSDTTQRVIVRWPRRHSFYTEEGRHRPLLFTESLRQALALLTHDAHKIPLGHRLGWEHIRSWVNPASLGGGAESENVTLLITHPVVRRRRMGSVHLTSRIEALREGMHVGSAEVHYTTHPPVVYDRLRARYADAQAAFARALPLTAPVSPAVVGRSDARDVVLTPTGTALEWLLRVDVEHGVLFDHPHDHVPGMVLLEAAAQAAQASVAHPVEAVEFDTEFYRYVEFDLPCTVAAQPGRPDRNGQVQVQVTAAQDGRPVMRATVTTVPRRG